MTTVAERTKAIVLLALPCVIYLGGLGHELLFDDLAYISENPLLRRPDALRVFWFSSEPFNYYPLFWSLLRIQWFLWGDNPVGYHAVSLAVHCLNALLVWKIASLLRLPAAWWVGALFAIHPLNVQTVAWAAEQKNTWSFLFMALAVVAFLKYQEKKDPRSYLAMLGAFVAALACKTSVVTLPLFLAVYCVATGKIRSMWLRLAPFFVAGAAAAVTTLWFEQHRLGAGSLVGTLDLWQRAQLAGATWWFYLEKAILPIHLTPMYRGWVDTTAGTHTAVPFIAAGFSVVVCTAAWRRIGAPIGLGLAFYGLMLLPFLGLFDTTYFECSLIADHWQYHALPGLLIAVVAAASRFAPSLDWFVRARPVVGAAAVVALVVAGWVHFGRFECARTLWSHVIAHNHDAWLAWYNLGNEHAAAGKYDDAIRAYRESLRVKPQSYGAHFNLANVLAATGDLEEADLEYRRARTIGPAAADNYVNRGALLLRAGRTPEATAEFARALELEPGNVPAEVNLITLHLRTGSVNHAFAYLEPAALRDSANSRRIADAIVARARRDCGAAVLLRQFATRACDLSGGQPDLRAALATLN